MKNNSEPRVKIKFYFENGNYIIHDPNSYQPGVIVMDKGEAKMLIEKMFSHFVRLDPTQYHDDTVNRNPKIQ